MIATQYPITQIAEHVADILRMVDAQWRDRGRGSLCLGISASPAGATGFLASVTGVSPTMEPGRTWT